MKIIRAKVSERLLTKASRLFTGTLSGRIIEVLQNARRAGATHIDIKNEGGFVTVRDNGRGIEDFAALLDLGGSHWSGEFGGSDLEASEDPAGVGLFCLAPREIVFRSKGFVATIGQDGWTGRVVEVRSDPEALPAVKPGIARGIGTALRFQDEPWHTEAVKPLAVFTGLQVTVDGERCPREPFIHSPAAAYTALGCRIQVVEESGLSVWHRTASAGRSTSDNVLVSFHGQVVGFNYYPTPRHAFRFLVDLTGAPTGIRLLLPARTQLIENEALLELKTTLEREAFLHLQKLGRHRLPYANWQRARTLGIELPEAELTYEIGLIHSELEPHPVEIVPPEDFQLDRCHRMTDSPDGDEWDESNAHLLAALGNLQGAFTPVTIQHDYDGYTWAQLPTITKVEVEPGKTLLECWAGSGQIIVVDTLAITVHTSDGKTYRSPVCMAVKPWECDKKNTWGGDYELYVTPGAQELDPTAIWFHLGGASDDGDTYDTQEYQFREELDAFWEKLAGPHEPLRARLVEACTERIKGKWRAVTIQPNGCVTIRFHHGVEETILPPRGKLEVRP